MKKQVKLLLSLVAGVAGVASSFAYVGNAPDSFYTLTTGGIYYEFNSSYTGGNCEGSSSNYCAYVSTVNVGDYATSGELIAVKATAEFLNKVYQY